MMLSKLLPGTAISVLLAILAILANHLPFPPFTIQGTVPHPIEPLLLAIILGILVGNTVSLPSKCQAGISFSAKSLLPIAIMLMGVRLDLHQLWEISSISLVINIICIFVALLATALFARWLLVETKLAKLIGIGTAICGSSAILACAPIIAADETAIFLSIAAINIFGTAAIFIFPVLQSWLHLSALQYGVLAGTSIQAIPQVVASGFAVSPAAGRIAVVVKLVRVILLAPMMFIVALTERKQQTKQQPWYRYIPPMVIGFLIFTILNALGLFSTFHIGQHVVDSKAWLTHISNWLILITMAAIGLMTNIKQLVNAGPKAIQLALLSMLVLLAFSLGLVYFLI